MEIVAIFNTTKNCLEMEYTKYSFTKMNTMYVTVSPFHK